MEVRRSFRVLLTSDKPLYRPGQTVHLRALALEALTGRPADGCEITFTVETPQQGMLLRQTSRLSAYGIAWTDFDLPVDAPHGQYRLTAALSDTLSERTVTVGQYETPRFRVEIDTAQPYYLPGETVQAGCAPSNWTASPFLAWRQT